MNGLENSISIVPNPLSDSSVEALKWCSRRRRGAKCFRSYYGHDGKSISSNIKYAVAGFSLDDFLRCGVVREFPTLIKIDVDGIEHLILGGAKKRLS